MRSVVERRLLSHLLLGSGSPANHERGIAEVRKEQGKLTLYVAIDRPSKFAFVELHEKAITHVSGDFLRHLIEAVPYAIHTVLTGNDIKVT